MRTTVSAEKVKNIWGLDADRIVERILATGHTRVMLHFPAGLSNEAVPIIRKLHETDRNVNAVVWSNPCFGACDLPYLAARELECGLLVTFGHSPMRKEVENALPTIHVEPCWRGKRLPVKKTAIETALRGFKQVGIAATVQYLGVARRVKKVLNDVGHTVKMSEGGWMSIHNGQVTGCDFAAVEGVLKSVDCVLLVSDGSFHLDGLALVMRAQKPLFLLNPTRGTIERIDQKPAGKKTLLRAATLLHSKTVFGILLSTKPGQKDLKIVRRLAELLRARRKTVLVLASDTLDPLSINNFSRVDVLVNTACPRIADDTECFEKPIVQAHDMINACLLE